MSAAAVFGLFFSFLGLSVYAAQQHNQLEAAKKANDSGFNPGSSKAAVSSTPQNIPVSQPKPPPAVAPTPPPAPATSGHFGTLGLGATLPSDASCASRVKAAAETRPANSTFNNTRGVGTNATYSRVTGNYTGTTDQILQWAACKWGIDEDIVRAQAAQESWWFQRHPGDFTSDPSLCVPGHGIGADGQAGQCPESIGILQVRYQFHSSAFAGNSATNSTSYNADYVYAYWRDCFEGHMTWLNDVERGSQYGAGDLWGCLGVWYSGRWHTSDANQYIAAVQNHVKARTWETADFKSAT